MYERSSGTINRIYVIALFLTLLLMIPLNLYGQGGNPDKPNKVEVKDGKVSVDVQDAEIPDILKEIEKGTGVKMTIGDKLVGQKVTASFEKKDIEDALSELLRGQYYVLSYAHDPIDKAKKTLKEVEAKGDVIGSKALKGKIVTVEIPYGTGKGEVRAEKKPEGGSIGPLSFAVDTAGTVYIADTWNSPLCQ